MPHNPYLVDRLMDVFQRAKATPGEPVTATFEGRDAHGETVQLLQYETTAHRDRSGDHTYVSTTRLTPPAHPRQPAAHTTIGTSPAHAALGAAYDRRRRARRRAARR